MSRSVIRYPDIVYIYDGTYEGLLTCIFESFSRKEIPKDIQVDGQAQLSLLSLYRISTDEVKARRVAASFPRKLGLQVTEFFQKAFLTCLTGKEIFMLRFIHMAFRYGPCVLDMLADDTVHILTKAIRHMTEEAHLLKGFIRFSDYHSFLVTVIHPKNFVLPLLQPHFSNRFSREAFLIFDENHNAALFHRPGESNIIPLTELTLEALDEEEQKYRALWQAYYETIAIKARYNPKCRMSHMPKRYWDFMTEFGTQGIAKYENTAVPFTPISPSAEKPSQNAVQGLRTKTQQSLPLAP